MNAQTEYSPTSRQAELIAALSVLDHDGRMQLLGDHAENEGFRPLIDLLSQVIGMANSVVENCRAWVETEAICSMDMHPHQAENINVPSMLGAAMGSRIAALVRQDGLCDGCAARIGTMANQCLPTVTDVDWCERKGEFLCHIDGLKDDGSPTKPCVGYARLHALKMAELA